MAVAEWSTSFVNDLPDSAFACIDDDGEKDEQGKTTPRSKRHYPHHNADGSLDLPHLRNALARARPAGTASCGVSHLEAHAEAEGVGKSAKETTMKAVKFVDGSDELIEGLAIPFGGPHEGKDIDGEDFGPDTDFAFDLFPYGRPVLYDHGTDPAMKAIAQGRQIEHEIRDEGVWAKAQLDKAAKYHATVKRLIDRGVLFFSSGSAPQMAAKNADGHITRWPWLELSLTPTPSNTLARPYAVKMADLIDHAEAANLDLSSRLVAEAMRALDNEDIDNDTLLDGVKFADLLDRLSVDGPAWVKARQDWHTKSGRRLSAATRERLMSHPQALRQLAEVLDELLDVSDAGKSAVLAAVIEAEMTRARSLGVPIPN